MKACGIYEQKKVGEPKLYFRLVPSESYEGGVAVEAVDANGERLALLARISQEMGIEAYEDVPKSLGFAMTKDHLTMQKEPTW